MVLVGQPGPFRELFVLTEANKILNEQTHHLFSIGISLVEVKFVELMYKINVTLEVVLLY